MNKRLFASNSQLFLINKNKGGYFDKRWLLLPVGILVIAAVVVLLFFRHPACGDWECFNSNLESCKRSKFIGGTDMIFEYKINGIDSGKCKIDIELLQGELNNQESVLLEGQDMSCWLPKGVVMIPESDIGNCHGLLKEGLQDLVIKRLHAYLIQNIGKINVELLDAASY